MVAESWLKEPVIISVSQLHSTELNAAEHDVIVTFISGLGNNSVWEKSLCLKGQFYKTRSRTICDLRITFTLLELVFLLPIFQLKTSS